MKINHSFFFLVVILMLNCTCSRPEITPAFLILTVEDFQDCIDVSDYNSIHDQNYDQKELDAIKQQNFTDVLVSLNGKELGYWYLPCSIPLLPDYSGKNNIRVIPCVRTANTSTTTLQYLFVNPIEQLFELEREELFRFPGLSFKYDSSVDFPVLETFTQSTLFKPRVEDEFPAAIEIFYDEELQKDIGRVILSDSAKFFDIVTSYFPLPGQGERLFWEISYKIINGQMFTHLGFENSMTMIEQNMMIFPATEGAWKKAYIDITNTIMEASYTASQVSTRLRITGLRNSTTVDTEFYFENIKLITMDAPYY